MLARGVVCLLLLSLALLSAGPAGAARVSDVQSTLHNLSSDPANPNTTKSTATDEVCVFCHTPHGASTDIVAPLWNRTLSDALYTTYTSSSIDVDDGIGQPTGGSKLCLSCHDGMVALGQVTNQPDSGFGSGNLAMQGTATDGTMPVGSGEATGFTRRLGTDLRNDHPISFTYDEPLATADGELSDPNSPQNNADIGNRSTGKHDVPLFDDETGGTDRVQCSTCHDPHLTVEAADGYTESIKFLRLNRFQDEANAMAGNTPVSANGPLATFSEQNDIVCISCHDKMGWENSAHANPSVADEQYKSGSGSPAELREFPGGIRVWQAACLNCHDTHTVSGSVRLLREGTCSSYDANGLCTDSSSAARTGGSGKAAIEETCYQCHTASATSILRNAAGTGNPVDVPDIESDFALTYRMPITTADQAATSEMHDISSRVADGYNDCVDGLGNPDSQCGADFIESQASLGNVTDTGGSLDNRHAECTDCHNPHRVVKSACFNGNDNPACSSFSGTAGEEFAQGAGTHNHSAGHTNLASGVLRGAWGVEPLYPPTPSFYQVPTSFEVRRGDPGTKPVATADADKNLTREYQVCLKCHSNYGYDDVDLTTSNWRCTGTGTGTRPLLVSGKGTTPSSVTQRTNFDCYTNQAREFFPGNSATNSGAFGEYKTNNHRSWHPVMGPTGRPEGTNRSTGTWDSPWNVTNANGGIGAQTMYCSDCHGTNAASGVTPDAGDNWGPHGSQNRFVLKGDTTGSTNELCLKCHNIPGGTSGFSGCGNCTHGYHQDKSAMNCNYCHVAVPHGWKNRSFLVNLNDVGPEAGRNPGTEIDGPYSVGPYYLNARLMIRNMAAPGNWSENDCGRESGSGSDDWGKTWMTAGCM